VPPVVHRVASLEAKVAAGAQFIQTQFCFDIPRFAAFMRQVREAGLHRHCALIVGVGTLSSAKALAWMARHVPGVHVPPEVIARIAAAPDQRAEGRQVLLETMRALTEIDGVAGVHLMGHKNEKILAEVIEAAGLRAQARPLTGPVAIAG